MLASSLLEIAHDATLQTGRLRPALSRRRPVPAAAPRQLRIRTAPPDRARDRPHRDRGALHATTRKVPRPTTRGCCSRSCCWPTRAGSSARGRWRRPAATTCSSWRSRATARPHFSTLASFVSSLGPAIGKVFAQVLTICDRQGLIGRRDVRHRRGEAAQQCLQGQERQAQGLRAPGGTRWRRRSSRCWPSSATADASGERSRSCERKAQRRLERLQARGGQAARMAQGASRRIARAPRASRGCRTAPTTSRPRCPPTRAWCKATPGWRRSMRSTRSSWKRRPTARGSEQELLLPVIEAIAALRQRAHRGVRRQRLPQRRQPQAAGSTRASRRSSPTTTTASAIRATQARSSTAPSPMRCGTRARSRPRKPKLFQPCDFQVAPTTPTASARRGKRLYRNGGNCNIGGRQAIKFTGTQRDCEKLSATGPVFTPSSAHPGQTGGHLRGQARQGAGESQRAHEAQDRHRARAAR